MAFTKIIPVPWIRGKTNKQTKVMIFFSLTRRSPSWVLACCFVVQSPWRKLFEKNNVSNKKKTYMHLALICFTTTTFYPFKQKKNTIDIYKNMHYYIVIIIDWVGGPDGKKLTPSQGVRHDQEPNHLIRPDHTKYFTWPIWKKKLTLTLTRDKTTVRFCSRAVRLFPAPLHKCVRPSYRYIVNRFEKNARSGPYGSYDKYNSLHIYSHASHAS